MNCGSPRLVLGGPKVGNSLGYEQGIDRVLDAFRRSPASIVPASIAFAGYNDRFAPHRELSSKIYGELASWITQHVIMSGYPNGPYLPRDSHLHVNFPAVTAERCNQFSDFKFILTTNGDPIRNRFSRSICRSLHLPLDTEVIHRKDGCYVSMSLLSLHDRSRGPDMSDHIGLRRKLRSFFSCLPRKT